MEWAESTARPVISVVVLEGKAMPESIVLYGEPLSIEQVVSVAEHGASVTLDPGLIDQMAPAARLVERVVEEGATVYGVTTGFGALASTRIDPARADELQLELLRSHAAGVGDPLPDQHVRAMLLLRARSLSQGYSGVRPIVVERLLDLLRLGLLPVVPGQGSVCRSVSG